MSGRGKKKLYIALELIFGISFAAATAYLFYAALFSVSRSGQAVLPFLIAAIAAVVFYLVLSVNALVHEGGHLLFGWISGMKFASVQISFFRFFKRGGKLKIAFVGRRNAVGCCEMYPKHPSRVRGRMIAFSLGGIICNLIYGTVFLALFFLLPHHPALLFFELFAPVNLYEGLSALYPISLPAGKMDGAVVRGLVKKQPSEVVALRVLTAQGILNRGTFSDIDEALLFDVPVVQEDDAAFIALTQLRWQYLFFAGNEEESIKQLLRLEELYCYLPQNSRAEAACDLAYAYGVLLSDAARAEKYLADAADALGTCAYYRALAACGQTELCPKALDCAEKEINGISELERKLISRISEKKKSVPPESVTQSCE